MSRGSQPQATPRPVAPALGGSAGTTPAPAELPAAAVPQRPALCRMVVVTTTGAIRGRTEHAAMITAVISDTVVDVTMFPSGEPPYPVQGVAFAQSPSAASGISWRWPPRV